MRNPADYVKSVSRLTPDELQEIASEFQPLTPCPKCEGWTVHVNSGKPPNWGRLNCSACGRLRRWLPHPKNWRLIQEE